MNTQNSLRPNHFTLMFVVKVIYICVCTVETLDSDVLPPVSSPLRQ